MSQFTLSEKLFLIFVRFFHRKQKRKYTGEPYFHHVVCVAVTVKRYMRDQPSIVAIALGHDLLEDTKCTVDQLRIILRLCGFGKALRSEIEQGIIDLTDVFIKSSFPDLNRTQRKKMETLRLGTISATAQHVKCADLYDNTKSITTHDPGFAKVYLLEKEGIIKVLAKASPELIELASFTYKPIDFVSPVSAQSF